MPHNSQGTTTSAYPPSSSHSSRSSSPSLQRSQTPPPAQRPKPLVSTPHTPSLDLDPDDVNARLRLLVNNSYFLPPAHAKPELSPIYLTPTLSKGATSPSAFKEFFRVGKKKEKKSSDVNGHVSPNGRGGVRPTDLLRTRSGGLDHGHGTIRRDLDFQPYARQTRSRVVVVRETVDNLPPPAVRAPLRTSSLPTRARPRTAPEAAFIDPTTQYDMPPPTHYPSFNNLRLDAAGLTGNVELDQFVPPGEPWSPTPSTPRSLRGAGGGMDPQERVWRRALLEQAVDLSLSSSASDPGHGSPGLREGSIIGIRFSNDENMVPPTPKSPKSKKSWWGRRDKDTEDTPERPSTSFSNKERDILRPSGHERVTHSLDVSVPPHSAPANATRYIGQCIVPNMHTELEDLERNSSSKANGQIVELPPLLRPRLLLPFGSSSSAPVSPLYQPELPGTPTLPMTPLSPRPAYRRSETRLDVTVSGEQVARDLMPGHSTIRKSLSSPLLSDLHETGVEVEDPIPFSSSCSDSLSGVAAPSFVLQDPHGVTSLMPSSTADSFTSGSHYSEDDQDHVVFDHMITSHEQPFGCHDEDGGSLDRWTPPLANRDHGDGRTSLDSFGRRVHSPDSVCPARASSTFGFRRSNVSVTNPSPLRGSCQDIEVDISGDPIEHLLLMESQRSSSPGAESQTSSLKGYASAIDHTFHGSMISSLSPSSPTSQSFCSTNTRLTSNNSQPDRLQSPEATDTGAPISFFDSVQHQSLMDEDGISSESDIEADASHDIPIEHDRYMQTQTLGRKSLNTIRPTPTFTSQFRNASQPQLPLSRGDTRPSFASAFPPAQPYDILDRKKPLTNTPLSPTSSGILSQLKAKSGKGPLPFSSRGKNQSLTMPMMLPESTFEMLHYPHGSAVSLSTGPGAGTSDTGSVEPGLRGFETASLQSSSAISLKQTGSWRQEHGAHDESLKKLDGLLTQHLEAEKDRLRKIATAARERGIRSTAL